MIINVVISTPAECREKQQQCHTQTANNMEDLQMPLVIDQDDGSSSRLTVFVRPTSDVVNMSGGA